MKNTTVGFLGVIGIWVTAAVAFPLVNVLNNFPPEQLMVFRGFLTALMALIGLRGVIGRADKYTYLIALTLPFATLGLFQGIRHWGVGPTIVIITATPLVNLAIGAFCGRRISSVSITGLVLMLGGVVMARWGGYFQWAGFLWSAFGTIMNGILYEFFSRAKASPLQKCFWGSMGMGSLGLALSIHVPWPGIAEPRTAALILGFAFVGGFLYWLANLLAFKNLPTTEAGILAQGEAPAVIIGASLLLDESFTLIQSVGVVIALCGGGYLLRWLSKENTQPTKHLRYPKERRSTKA